MSGGDTGRQLQLELKSLSRANREQLLNDAGFSVKVPAGKNHKCHEKVDTFSLYVGQGLAMRCDVGLPWSQLRQLRK